jgi:hypothetical protein
MRELERFFSLDNRQTKLSHSFVENSGGGGYAQADAGDRRSSDRIALHKLRHDHARDHGTDSDRL